MIEIVIAAALIGLNGLFALSELAVVSARRARLRALAEQGRRGAATALALAEDPGRFLSTVQIGITLVGILAGAFSGAVLGQRLDAVLERYGVPVSVSEPLAYVVVLGAITYLSVIVGELVPKNLALRNAEGIACAVAPAMNAVSRAAAPVVWLLDASTKLIFRVAGIGTEAQVSITDQDIRALMAEAETAGVIETDERRMIAGVMRLADRAVRGLMKPRTEVDWIDLADTQEEIRTTLLTTTHSRLPVADGGADNVIGVVQVRELLAPLLRGESFDLRAVVRPAPVIPDTVDALVALAVLRRAAVPMALVHDEYGHFEGIVTPGDVLDAITGAFRSDEPDAGEPEAVRRPDGSWLVAGSMHADEMAEQLGLALPADRDYETVAGLVLTAFERLPATGEAIEAHGWRFEVIDLDGRRIDKVLATRLPS
ncbi:MAG: hemolysin family protein [Salinarimonas sp.]